MPHQIEEIQVADIDGVPTPLDPATLNATPTGPVVVDQGTTPPPVVTDQVIDTPDTTRQQQIMEAAQKSFSERTDADKQLLQEHRASKVPFLDPNNLTDSQQNTVRWFINGGGDPALIGASFTPTISSALSGAVQQSVTDLTSPTLPQGATFDAAFQGVQEGEFADPLAFQLGGAAGAGAGVATAAPVSAPDQFDIEDLDPFLIEGVPAAEAIEGTLSAASQVTAVVGTETPEFQAALEEERDRLINFPVDPRATVREQYSLLMADTF